MLLQIPLTPTRTAVLFSVPGGMAWLGVVLHGVNPSCANSPCLICT